MVGKKCSSCDRRVSKKSNYCYNCGSPVGKVSNKREEEDFGLLGRSDSLREVTNELRLPFGLGKMVNSLVKQLENQLKEMDFEDEKVPRGFRIKVSTGGPQMNQVVKEPVRVIEKEEVSQKEIDRRIKLPKIETNSRIRRLGDKIIYEIETPGVKSRSDIVLTKLATGIEIKAYSKNKCYVKFIPLTVEVERYFLKQDKVFVELKV